MTRDQIQDKHKWALEHIFSSDEAWETEFNGIKSEYKAIGTFKGRLSQKTILLETLKLSDKIGKTLLKLYAYAHMKKDQDSSIDTYVSMQDRIMSLYAAFSAESSYISSELADLDEKYLDGIISDSDFSDYDYDIKEILRTKKHILSDKEEKILSQGSVAMRGTNSAFTMLNNLDLPLPTLKINGQKEKLTFGKYSYYLISGDAKTRKTVFKGMYDAYKSFINTYASLYGGSVKSDNFYATVRGFDSALEQALHKNDIPKIVYNNLLKAVKKALPIMHDYMALRKKVLGLSSMGMYDLHTPIVEGMNMELEYEDAYELCKKGLSAMGAEYAGLLDKARDDRWIDVFETKGKRGGAYAFGVYGVHPYIMLNYSKTLNDVFTVAHELGHAMHSYYSADNQPFAKENYTIFVAEVASTVNEVLLLKHMIKEAKTKSEKAYLLNHYLDMFRTTLFRQSMFAEFEMMTHDMDKAGQPLTVGSLCDTYMKLNKMYYGKSVKHNDEIKYEWARIPHFYNAFYVYQYATGLTAAVNIAKRILEEDGFSEVYKDKFLKAGGHKGAYEILKDAGIDLGKTDSYEIAMGEFADTLEELKKLL